MRKEYEVTCQVDMCAERVEKVRVTTNLEAKAVRLAIEKGVIPFAPVEATGNPIQIKGLGEFDSLRLD